MRKKISGLNPFVNHSIFCKVVFYGKNLVIYILYTVIILAPSTEMMLGELKRNPQDEMCQYVYPEKKDSPQGLIFVSLGLEEYSPIKHKKLQTFFIPAFVDKNIKNANWIDQGIPCQLQLSALLVPFIPCLFFTIPCVLLLRKIFFC